MSQLNTYKDDYLKASENLRLVLPFLSKYQIPASPLNYQIGYDVVSGANSALKKAVDKLLEEQDQLSEKKLLELYKQYIAQDDQALESIRRELHKIITNIRSEYADSNGELSDYMNSLNGFAEILAGSDHSPELGAEVQKVMQDTRSTEESQRKLKSQMNSMMQEVESLRSQLQQVREESLTDALTGLANRKAFDQMLEQVIKDTHEQDSPFSVVIADIDFFKKFNDTYGHLVGDKVLRYVSKIIKACVKGKDLAARFGGEEFTLVLPETDLAGARIVAEQVRKAISKKNLTDKGNHEDYGRITISLGVSQYNGKESPAELLERADQALYQAKANGRNKVEIAE